MSRRRLPQLLLLPKLKELRLKLRLADSSMRLNSKGRERQRLKGLHMSKNKKDYALKRSRDRRKRLRQLRLSE